MHPIAANDFRLIFNDLPGLYLILAPDFTIVAVSNAYLSATMTEREAIIGLGLFEVFPDNPDDKDADGVLNLRASLNAVKQFGKPHRMAVQKYDIRKPDGAFEERYWSPLNSPVFNEQSELLYIIHNVVDVTNSRKVEVKLKKSEKDYHLLVNSVKDYAIFMVDPNGMVASWNSGAESIKGYAAEEILGKPFEIFYSVEDINNGVPKSNLQMALQYGHFETEGLRLRKDGTSFWANIVFTALKDESGILYGYSKITRDITLQKQLVEHVKKYNEKLEAEVKERTKEIINNEKRFRALIENSHDIISLVDASFKIIYRSPSAEHITGWTNDEFLGEDGIKYTHPDDWDKASEILNESVDNPAKPVGCLIRNLHKNGHYLWLEGVIINLLQEESVKAIVFNFRDVTERIEAKQELERSLSEKHFLAKRMSIILNTLPANIALLDANGFIIEVNDAWRKFADDNGFKGSNKYCIGDNYLSISSNALGIEEEDGVKVAAGITDVLENRLTEFVYEYSCHSPKTKRWFRMVASPLQDKEFAGAVVMHIDISELRKLEQERLNAKIKEQKKLSKALLAGQEIERNRIGQELHDNINQILVGTKLYLGAAGNKNTEVKELIKYPIELIDSCIQEIRLLCRKLVTPLVNIDLEVLISELLNSLAKTEKTKTRFIYTVTNRIISDDLQLNMYRIIQELINNILKYAEATNVNITVLGNGKTIHITVTDNGKGFDTDKKRKGIGISNIINRVRSFNGEIEIESAPGKGCCTDITIPY
jgi:PAS domain S-box-containing protein